MAFVREVNIDVNVSIHMYVHISLSSIHNESVHASFVGLFLLLKGFREKLRNWSRLKKTKRIRQLYATLDPILDFCFVLMDITEVFGNTCMELLECMLVM